MTLLKRMVARARSKARAIGPRARLASLAAAALVVAGGLWLALDTAAPRPAWRRPASRPCLPPT